MGSIVGSIRKFFTRRVFARSIYGETLVEDSLIAAVASILVIRLFLSFTGYPQLGGETLHIAHMLWGGLFMFISVFLLLGFLSRGVREFAAIIGGIGFGIFIDELGKFITRDNDYFFKPAIALIYIIFILIFLSIRLILRLRILCPEECIANALEIVQQASVTGLTPGDRETAIRMLDLSSADEDMKERIRSLIDRLETAPLEEVRFLIRLREHVSKIYRTTVDDGWFTVAVAGFFAVMLAVNIYRIVTLIDWQWGLVFWCLGGGFIILIMLLSYRLPGKLGRTPLIIAILAVSGLTFWAFTRFPQVTSTPSLIGCNLLSPVLTVSSSSWELL